MSGPSRLKPSVNPFRGKSNRFWFKLTAASFTVKVLIIVGFFFAIKYAGDAALGDRDADAEDQTHEESR